MSAGYVEGVMHALALKGIKVRIQNVALDPNECDICTIKYIESYSISIGEAGQEIISFTGEPDLAEGLKRAVDYLKGKGFL